MVNHPGGREKLLALGLRNVPILARGTEHMFAMNLDDVAKFVGIDSGHKALPPDELIKRWLIALRMAQRYIRQVPTERINELAIHNRARSIRMVGHHIFRIGEAFLEVTVNGVEFTNALIEGNEAGSLPLKEGTFPTGEDIALYGETIIERLERWWSGLEDRSCLRKVKTYFGMQTIHVIYERSTWHSAQHVRQMADVLQRLGIEPDGYLTSQDLAGLPMPERLWE